MYVADAVGDLISSLRALCRPPPQHGASPPGQARTSAHAAPPAPEADNEQRGGKGSLGSSPNACLTSSVAAQHDLCSSWQQCCQASESVHHVGSGSARQKQQQQSWRQGPGVGARGLKRRKTQRSSGGGHAPAGEQRTASEKIKAAEHRSDYGGEGAGAVGHHFHQHQQQLEQKLHGHHNQQQQQQQQHRACNPASTSTEVLIAHGRNRTAEGLFLEKVSTLCLSGWAGSMHALC